MAYLEKYLRKPNICLISSIFEFKALFKKV